MRRSILFLGLLAAACAVPAVQASIVYQYVALDQAGNTGLVSGSGNSATLTLAAGSTYTFDVYLQETLTGADLANGSWMNSPTGGNGLIGAGFSFVRNAAGDAGATIFGAPPQAGTGSGPPQDFGGPDALRGITNIAAGNTTGKVKTGSLSEGFTAVHDGGVLGQQAGPGITRVLLGSITVKYQTKDTTFTLKAASSSSNGTTIPYIGNDHGLGFDLDTPAGMPDPNDPTFINNNPAWSGALDLPFTLGVTAGTTAIPEPSSMILGGFAIFGGGFGYLRRRRAAVKATEVVA